MPHDMPDDYAWLPGSIRSPLADMGELAARLGSPVVYDRRGEVIWFDVFNRGLTPWEIAYFGTGAGIGLSVFGVTFGGYSCKITPGTQAGQYSRITHYLTPESVTRIGIEATAAFVGQFDRFNASIVWTGTDFIHTAIASINATDQTIDLMNDAGNFEAIADIPISFWAGSLHHTVKVVADITTGYYVRLFFDDLDFDVSDIKYDRSAALNTQGLEITLRYQGNPAINAPCYIGHIVVTSNEP